MQPIRNVYLGVKTGIYMHILYTVMISLITISCPSLQNYNSYSSVCFYLATLLVLLFYNLASLRNPGFLVQPSETPNRVFHRTSDQLSHEVSVDVQHNKRLHTSPTNTSALKYNKFNDENSVQENLHSEKSENYQETSRCPPPEIVREPDEENQEENPCDTTYSGDKTNREDEYEPGENENDSYMPESVLYVETRFCTVCNMDQPVRTKHCRECDRCVTLHDHHCPWLGVCVGEKNRFYFYWYLVSQCVQIWWADVMVVSSFESPDSVLEWVFRNGLRVGILVILAFFTLMVSCLVSFHTYIAMKNLTTWEIVSWDRISYLKNWPKKLGSPFSKGFFGNLYQYCCEPLPKAYRVWDLPSHVPEANEV